jgi:hypothetical protein
MLTYSFQLEAFGEYFIGRHKASAMSKASATSKASPSQMGASLSKASATSQASTHHMSADVRSTLLAKHLSFASKPRRSGRKNASMGHNSGGRKDAMMADIRAATTCCSQLTNALGRVFDTIQSVPEKDMAKLNGAIKKFFGTMPDEDSDWTHNLWTGTFYPILAYCTLYDVNVDWEKQLDLNDEEMSMLGELNSQYVPLYRFGHVYGTLGNAVQEHLEALRRTELIMKPEWSERKQFTMIAFEDMDDVPSLCAHVGALINQDRYLRKIQKKMPKNMEPWHSAARYFPIRPDAKQIKLQESFVVRAIRDYSFDRKEEYEADATRIHAIMHKSREDTTKGDDTAHADLRVVSQILGLALTVSSII